MASGTTTEPLLQEEMTFEAEQFTELATSTPHDEVMYKIMMCESGGIATAKNPNSSAKGLYQVIDGTWRAFQCTGDPYNAEDNRRCAEKIAEDGLHHWDASATCWQK